MKAKCSIISWFLIFQFLLISCNSAKSEPLVNIENDYINQQVRLFVPNQFNSFETTSPIVLKVQYYSNSDIVFPNNYNVRIFKQTRQGWKEIQEKPILRLPEDDIVFSMETAAIRFFTVYPDLADYMQTYELRFYIFGDRKEGPEIEQVAAFVDVKLSP